MKPGVRAPLRNPADANVPGIVPPLETMPTEPESEPVPDAGEKVPPLEATAPADFEEFTLLPVD